MTKKLVINGDVSSKTILSNFSLSSLPSITRQPDLDGQEAARVDRAFEEMEVWEVVQDMNGDKAPGPDGFSMGFLQSCWDVIKEDVTKVFLQLHEPGKFEKTLNATFITLYTEESGGYED